MKYRHKPTEVEAYQWFPKHHPRYNGQKIEFVYRTTIDNLSLDFDYCKVDTNEGTKKVFPGDWIIKGVKGEVYVCRNDIFQMTYEKIED